MSGIFADDPVAFDGAGRVAARGVQAFRFTDFTGVRLQNWQGPAGPCRVLSREEIVQIEAELIERHWRKP